MLSHPLQSETLQELAANESKEKKPVATEGMMWLMRYSLPKPLGIKYLVVFHSRLQHSVEVTLTRLKN